MSEAQTIENMIVRSRNLGCFKLGGSAAWGRFLIPTEDPDGRDINESDLKKFMLIKDFPKLAPELWAPIVSLYFELCDPSNRTVDSRTEVSVLLLRSEVEDDNWSKSKWRVLVPQQEVGAASVQAKFDKCCDIVTGEEITEFPPKGWVHAGSSHSHNTMGAFFSKTDDDNELGVPGMHVVVGDINLEKNTYRAKASIVLRGKRWDVSTKDVIDITPTSLSFHENVLKYIEKKKYGTYSSTSYGSVVTTSPSSSSSSTYEKKEDYSKPSQMGFGSWSKDFSPKKEEDKLDTRTKNQLKALRSLVSSLKDRKDLEEVLHEIGKELYFTKWGMENALDCWAGD